MYQTILEIAQGILIIGGALCMILLFVILVIGIFTSVKVLEIAQKISRTVGYVRGSVVEPVVHTFTKIHRRLWASLLLGSIIRGSDDDEDDTAKKKKK